MAFIGNGLYAYGYAINTSDIQAGVSFPVTMRSTPSFSSSAANTFLMQSNQGNYNPSSIGLQVATPSTVSISVAGGSTIAGQGAKLLDATSTSYLNFDAEL